MDSTQTPNTPQELLDRQGDKEVTLKEVTDLWLQLSYEDKDNFIFHVLHFMRNFYSNCGRKELEKETPDVKFLCRCVSNTQTLNNMITLHETV